MRLAVVASLIAATSTGCQSSAALKAAAKDKGVAAARVHLPVLPGDCREQEPHAPIAVGDEVRTVLKAERRHLDKANARVLRCAGHYDRTTEALK